MASRWRLLLILIAASCGSPITPTSTSDGTIPYPAAPTRLDLELSGCPSDVDIADITEVEVRFGNAVKQGAVVCTAAGGSRDLTSMQRDAYWSLIIMKRLRYTQPLPWTDRVLFEWFTSAVRVVVFDSTGRSSHTGVGDRVITIELGQEPLRPAHRWDRIDTLIAVSVHEARHWEGFTHTCEGGRDRAVADMGAFGVHNLYFEWNGKNSDPSILPSEWRPYELYRACEQRKSAFCDEPKAVRCQ